MTIDVVKYKRVEVRQEQRATEEDPEVFETVDVEEKVDSLNFMVRTKIYHTQNVKI